MEFSVYTSDVSGHLYYITHIDNVSSIISGGILSHNSIEAEKLDYTPIYDTKIVSNRKNKEAGGKSLWHYANLYFQPRNPMLYRVIMEKSPETIAVIAVRKSIIETSGVYISDGNAASGNTKFYAGSDYHIAEKQIQEMTKLKWWSSSG